MLIHKASLTYRFYRWVGWTREKVAELGPDIQYVIPRFFNDNLEAFVREHSDKNWKFMFEGDCDWTDYYAVYNEDEFAKLNLEGHEIRDIMK